MKIVVVGAGPIAGKLLDLLRARGHHAVAPASGRYSADALAAALAGADIALDVAAPPTANGCGAAVRAERTGRRLLRAAVAAGVKHHLALSLVGTHRLAGSAYCRRKAAQERLIRASGLPYTIVHATQLFESLGAIAEHATDGLTVRLPPAYVQPIASDDVAAALVQRALSPPLNTIVEIAGPDRLPLADAVRLYLAARRDARTVVVDAEARYLGAELDEYMLLPLSKPRLGKASVAAWLAQQTQAAH